MYLDIDSSRKDKCTCWDTRGEWPKKTNDQRCCRLVSDNAEQICWCGDRSLSAAMDWLQPGNTRSLFNEVNIKLSVIVIT